MKLYHSEPMNGYRLVTREATLSDLKEALKEYGEVSVPIHPTESMFEVGYTALVKALTNGSSAVCWEMYKAMIEESEESNT